jgi:hypothetical protein
MEIRFRWKGLMYWGTALPNAKFNNLEDVEQKNESHQQVLLYGSVNVNTFDNLLNHWKKIEVAGCGKISFFSMYLEYHHCFFKVINYYQLF